MKKFEYYVTNPFEYSISIENADDFLDSSSTERNAYVTNADFHAGSPYPDDE